MERLNRINEAGTAYLIAETDLNSIRLMGAVGRKYRAAKEAAESARDNLVAVFKESGYTLEELEALRMPDGNTVCLPYLAALIRLADEIDVAAARNPKLLYDIESLTDEVEIIENKKVRAVRELAVTEDEFILYVDRRDEEILGHIRAMVVKMQKTLDYCRRVALQRCPYVITQQRVRMEEVG